MIMAKRVACLALVLAVVTPRALFAQATPLSEILVQLIQAEVRLAPPPPGTPFASHEAHFLPGEDQVLTPFLFNQAIVSQLSSYPIGSAAGGFTYTFDAALGTYSRSSKTFGPSFLERALTIGKGRLNLGASYQHASFSSFEDKDIEGGDIRFYLTHQPVGGFFFEGDLVETALDMNLETDTFALLANYGLTDKFDVGVALPIVHVSLDASINATVLRLATLDTPIHVFPGGGSTGTFSDSGSATGIGDILLRGKYHFLSRGGGGLAAAVDLRLPTGDEANLLGTGATQAKFFLIGSSATNRFSPHFNIGYTVSGESSNTLFNVTDEFNWGGGTEIELSPRVTLNVDFIGRQLVDSGRLVDEQQTFNWMTAAGVSGSNTFTQFALREGSLNLVTSAVGVKFNPARNMLISANVLFPMTSQGLRSNPVPVISFDYGF
jgi:Putative MetA-pathway of phenol degradation